MKTLNINVWLVMLIGLLGIACNKDETKLLATPGAAASLEASASSIVLSKENAEEEALALQWTPADFGYQAAISNVLQIGLQGSDFEGAKEIALNAGDDTYSFTTLDLNALLLSMELPTGEVSELELRLKSSISSDFETLFSDALPLSVTPYAAISYLYVVGGYNGWNEQTGLELISPTSNGVYTGSIFFPEDNLEFKLTLARSWDNAYGDDGEGKIKLNDGSGNITAPQSGMLDLTVNTNNNTIQYTPQTWGIVGDGTVGGWDNDTEMSYDPEAGVWKVTTTLSAGFFKFRKNGNWDVNLGGSGGNLTLAGDDIAVTAPGTYEISLNVTEQTYTLTSK